MGFITGSSSGACSYIMECEYMLLVYTGTGKTARQCKETAQVLGKEPVMGKVALFAVKITGKLVKKGLIQEEDALLYSYGIENGIWLAASVFTAVVTGLVTGRLGVVMVFLLFYSMLRSYSGGLHCRSRLVCYVCSAAVLFVPVYSYRLFMDIMPGALRIFPGLAALSVVLVLSPVESRNKKLDDIEKKYYKRMSHCIVSIQACFLVLLYCMGMYRYFYAGYTAIIFVALFMVLGKITAKCYT